MILCEFLFSFAMTPSKACTVGEICLSIKRRGPEQAITCDWWEWIEISSCLVHHSEEYLKKKHLQISMKLMVLLSTCFPDDELSLRSECEL